MAQNKGAKKLMNMVYGLGAAVVILGALFKIMHWPFGNLMLILGLIVEALVFAISAFEPVDNELDWTLVYPELAGGEATARKAVVTTDETDGLLSKKLDEILREAKIDATLMESLGASIRNFEGAARNITPTVDAIESQKRYSEEMNLAASQLESLNSIYKVQVESAAKQSEINDEVVEQAGVLKEQMHSLANNLSSLNGVYGGMLTAMHVKG